MVALDRDRRGRGRRRLDGAGGLGQERDLEHGPRLRPRRLAPGEPMSRLGRAAALAALVVPASFSVSLSGCTSSAPLPSSFGVNLIVRVDSAVPVSAVKNVSIQV